MRVAKLIVLLATLLFCSSSAIANAGERPAAGREEEARYAVRSPDGEIELTFVLKDTPRSSVPTYRIAYRGETIVGDSRLGRVFEDASLFAGRLAVESVPRRSRDTTYKVTHGATATARNHYNELVLTLREEASPHRRLDLIFRVYNDGAAFRYQIPEQDGLTEFTIVEERSTFAFTGNPTAYTLPLGSYTTPQEGTYEVIRLRELSPADSILGVPLLLEYPGGPYVAVTEADLTDYAGMYLSGTARPGTLVSRLSPYPDEPKVKVKAAAPHVSPWRVVMIADEPAALIESTIIINLNDPARIEDLSWIEPGKVLFTWWNGFVVKGADIEGGMNTATIKYYIDFCAEQGIKYMSLDGMNDKTWYGGPTRPYQGADITTGNPDFDVQEIVQYAHKKGVELRLWIHWKAVQEHMDTAFPVYERWGVDGVMLDFMDRDDQQMVGFYHEVLQKAAEHHLTVSFHGAYKPTGIRRTYPNLLTREAVRNMEYYKFAFDNPPTAEHEVTVPFTRMLAGPLDFHQGAFRAVREEAYEEEASGIAPVVIGTRARALAMYVVYFDPLPMLVDYPMAYRGEEGFEFLKQVPTTWDETQVLNGAVGDYITIARRKGETWYVGSMTDGEARTLDISLHFLPEGTFVADLYADVLEEGASPNEVRHERRVVTREDTIRVRMAPRGGHAIRLRPAMGLPE